MKNDAIGFVAGRRRNRNAACLVEDLDGAYWPERGGGLGHPDSFVERGKALIDQINSVFSWGQVTVDPALQNIMSVSFYLGIVAIEKAQTLNRDILRLPTPLR